MTDSERLKEIADIIEKGASRGIWNQVRADLRRIAENEHLKKEKREGGTYHIKQSGLTGWTLAWWDGSKWWQDACSITPTEIYAQRVLNPNEQKG